jgi:transposase
MRRRNTRPTNERKSPFFVGIDIGKQRHYACVLDADGAPCLPNATAFANTREGYARLYTTLQEATAHASPTEVTVGCEATGPYWLNLYEALSSQGYRVLVLNPLYMSRPIGGQPCAEPRPIRLMPS